MSRERIVRFGLMFVGLLLVIVPVIGCAPEEAVPLSEEKVIKLGLLAPLTGAICAKEGLIGWLDYYRYTNEQGGIEGIEIEPLWVDEAADAARAITVYKRMKGEGIVAAMTYHTTPTLAILSFTEQDEIPVATNAVSLGLFSPPRWAYTSATTTAQEMVLITEWYLQEWKKKGLDRPMRLAALGSDMPYGRGAIEPLVAWAEKQEDIDLVSTVWVSPMAIDYTSDLLLIKSKEPDAIATCAGSWSGGLCARDAAKAGLSEDVPFLQQYGGVITGAAVELGKGEMGRIYTPYAWWTWAEDKPQMELWRELQQRYHGETIETFDWTGGWGLSAILTEAVRKAVVAVGYENLNGAAVKEHGFDTMTNFDPTTGALVTYTDYSGDRIGGDELRILHYDSAKEGWFPVTDWLKVQSISELER